MAKFVRCLVRAGAAVCLLASLVAQVAYPASMIKADGNWLAFFERPLAGILGALTLVVCMSPLVLVWWRGRRRRAQPA